MTKALAKCDAAISRPSIVEGVGGMPPDHYYEVTIRGRFDAEMCSIIEDIFYRGKLFTEFAEISIPSQPFETWSQPYHHTIPGKPEFKISFHTK